VLGGASLPVIMALLIPSYGVGVAICMMFVYYAYVLWFTVKGCRVGLD
jgi:FHS family L-fucose permease-like MFS transporter